MIYTGGKLVTATERVHFYLSNHRSYREELEAPIDITQAGIAGTVGISLGNVGRAIRPLIKKDWVETHKVHVSGIRMKRNAYYLSEEGRIKAEEVKSKIMNLKVEIIDLNGNKTCTSIGKAHKLLPPEIGIIDVVRETENGVFDCELFLKHRNHAERLFFDPSRKFSKPRYFFGRSEELKRISEWFDSPSSHTLVLKGMPGIGKTTLIARMLEEYPHALNVHCYSLRSWSSPRSLLRFLSEFLMKYGKGELKGYIDANTEIDLSEVEYILSQMLPDTPMTLVFDDFHNADAEIRDFFSMLQDVVIALPNVKLIVAGRRIESFYDRKDVAVQKQVLEVTLEGLDNESTVFLAKTVHVPEELIKNIYGQTSGHPLFIELLSQGGGNPGQNIEQYIVEEFTKILKKEELELLKYISVYRYPVQRSWLRSHQPALVRLVKHSLLTQSPDDFVYIHDMVKDTLYRGLSHRDIKTFHSKAAEHYLESSTIASTIEVLHHLICSGQIESATKILLDKEEKILKGGRTEGLAKILSIILIKNISMTPLEKARVVSMQGTVLSFTGEWDDAVDHFRRAGKLAKDKGAKPIEMKCNLGIAKILLRRNEYKESKVLFERILEWANKHDEAEAAEVNYQLGSLCVRQANLDEAINNFKNALRISTKLGDKHQTAKAHYGLGTIYHRKNQFKKALESKNKALDISLQIGDEHTAAKILTSIGGTLTELGELDKAIETNNRAIDLARTNGAVLVLAYALSNAGAGYLDKPDLINSSKYLNEASNIFERLGERRMVASVKLNLAFNSALKKNSKKASRLFREGTAILEELKDRNKLIIANFSFGQTFTKVEEPEKARRYFKKALQLSKEIGDNTASEEILLEIKKLN